MRTLQRIEALRHLPWYSVDLPADIANGLGMIFADEQRMLYTLARDYFTGAGRIIDGGTYLGDSSLALGFGLKDRGYRKEPVIDAFDRFIIDAASVQLHFRHEDWTGRTIKAGDNVRFVYERYIAAIADYVRIHEGDVEQMVWSGGPIEILFSDVSKSWSVNDYIITNWISNLIPETGILIQQDQVQEYHVWVAITMEILIDCFEVIDYTKNSSMVYRLKHEVPSRMLQKSLHCNISPAEMEFYYLSFLERFRRMGIGRYKGWHLGMVEAGLAVTYGFHIGDLDKARHALRKCEEKFHDIPDTMYRLNAIKGHLEARTPCPGSKLSRAQLLAHQDQDATGTRLERDVNEELMMANRHQVALQNQEIEAARRQIGAQEQSIVDLSRELENREWQSEQLVQRIQDLERARAALEESLEAILQSKRWILINGVRGVLYSLPRLVRSSWRRVRGKGRQPQHRPVALATRRRSLAGRSPGQHSPSSQATERATDRA